MDIRFTVNNNVEIIKRKNEFIWKREAKPRYVTIFYLFAFGLFFTIYGAITPFTTKTIYQQGNTTIYDLHIGLSIGLPLILLAIIGFLSLNSNRREFFKRVDRYINIVAKNKMYVHVSDESILYEDCEMKQEFKWEKFSGFVYKKGFLLFYTNKNIISSSFTLYEKEFSPEEFNSFIAFLRKRMRQID